MKILIVHHSGIIGGAGVSLLNVVRGLLPRHEITLMLPSDPYDMLREFRRLQAQNLERLTLRIYGRRIGAMTYYSGGDGVFSRRFWYRVLLAVRQRRYWNQVLAEEHPDVLIVNSLILAWMSRLKAAGCCRVVCFVRETMRGWRGNLFNRLLRRFLDRFSLVFFLSDYDLRQFGLTRARCEVAYDFVSGGQFAATGTRSEELAKYHLRDGVMYLLYVGGVSEMKGFDIAVDAVLSCDNRVELLVAGNDFEETIMVTSGGSRRYATKMREYVREKDTSGRIHMLGRQSNMSGLYAVCDAVIFPMRSPHQARPVFEAGNFARPVLISDFENIREFVNDSVSGFLVSPDAGSFAQKITLLADNPEMRKRMGTANHKESLAGHDEAENIARINEALDALKIK